MAEELNWQPIASRDLDREDEPHLRISAAGRCPRALGYATQGVQETNPPDQQARNRMAMGHMAEVLIIREMEKYGWQTENTVLSPGGQLELELEIPGTDGETVRGHPDGICWHEEYTRNLKVPLEAKSMSEDKALEVMKQRIVNIYPGYLAQISLYGLKLKEMGLISHAERGIFGMMDREGRVLPPERASWDTDYTTDLLKKLAGIVNRAKQGEVADRPHAQSSTECKYCRYHTHCWGTDPDQEQLAQRETVTSQQEEVLDAARRWAELKPQVDRARDMLQAVSNSHGMADVNVEGVIGGYFQPRSERFYDPDALERAVPADILEKCRTNLREKPPAFWVRMDRH